MVSSEFGGAVASIRAAAPSSAAMISIVVRASTSRYASVKIPAVSVPGWPLTMIAPDAQARRPSCRREAARKSIAPAQRGAGLLWAGIQNLSSIRRKPAYPAGAPARRLERHASGGVLLD